MKAVFELISSLPHIKPITLAFSCGALTTWVWFSAEFALGGIINLLTATERELAWMPSTNDANESCTGAYCVVIRGKPTWTLHQYSVLAMYRRNNTQNFMDTVLTAEDHTYIMREARRIDVSDKEAQRRRDIIDFCVKTADMQKAKALAKSQKAAKDLQDHLSRRLVPLAEMGTLTIPLIHDQLNSYHARGVPNIQANSHYPCKAEKLDTLKEAFQWFDVHRTPMLIPEIPVSAAEVSYSSRRNCRTKRRRRWRNNMNFEYNH